jgi:hypothetical protein
VTDGQIQHEKQGAHCVWDANQQWRQASVMSGETALALGLMTEPTAKRFAIVATHDCDCVTGEDEEPQLELIIGREIEKEEFDGNLALAKSTRRLHLEIEQHGKYIELSSITKGSIDKTALMGMVPSQDVSLNTDQRRVFRRWLAARYERVSFPDELVRRLRPVIDHFKKVSKNNGANVIGIYIQFEPDQELERDSVEPYSFKIFVVYDSSKTDAPIAAERMAKSLEAKFISEFKLLDTISGNHWHDIELEVCAMRSDIDFTLQEALSSYVFRLDDVSLKIGDQGKIPAQ